MRGAWLGLDWGHSRAHLYRSVLEGLAYEYVCRLDLYRKISGKDAFKDVCVIGGGSANDLWNQIKADALGIDYVKLRDAPYECRGTALVAGGAVGIYENLSELSRATVCEEQRTLPAPTLLRSTGKSWRGIRSHEQGCYARAKSYPECERCLRLLVENCTRLWGIRVRETEELKRAKASSLLRSKIHLHVR